MAFYKSLFALSLILLGVCHPAEPPNSQECLSSSISGIFYPQTLADASESLKKLDIPYDRENAVWASKTAFKIQAASSHCSMPNFYESLECCSLASRLPHGAELGTWSDSRYSPSSAIFNTCQDTGEFGIYGESDEGLQPYDTSKASLATIKSEFGIVLASSFLAKSDPDLYSITTGTAISAGLPDATSKRSYSSFKAKFDDLLSRRRVSQASVSSFLQLPPYDSTYTAGSISPLIFRLQPLEAFTTTSELKIDIALNFPLPPNSSGYACKIATITYQCTDGITCAVPASTCAFDQASKILTLTGFTAGDSNQTQIIIEDIPTDSRLPGVKYPGIPGLYSIPISLKYSDTYTFTGAQSILIMPSATPATALLTPAHTGYLPYESALNMITLTLEQSSSNFESDTTIDIFFPLKNSNGGSLFNPTLGLCREYDLGSTLICKYNYQIESYDEIPCMDQTNTNIKFSCKIVIGSSGSNTPTIIKAQILSGSAQQIHLSFIAMSPSTSSYEVSAIINKPGLYSGATFTKSQAQYTGYSSSKSFSFAKLQDGSFKLMIDKVEEVSKILIYLGPSLHRFIDGTSLHDDIYTDLDLLLTSSITASDSTLDISLRQNVNPGMIGAMNGLFLVFIKSDGSLKGIGSSTLSYGKELTATLVDDIYDKTSIAFNTVSWVTLNFKPNLRTDIYTKLTVKIQGIDLIGSSCFFIDASGKEDSSVCSADIGSDTITLSGLSPYAVGSIHAIDISQQYPIKIKALLKFTICNPALVKFTLNQYMVKNNAYSYLHEILEYSTTSICGITAKSLHAYATVLEEVPVSAVSCTGSTCDNYGEIRFILNIPQPASPATYNTIYVHTGGQLTTVASGASLRCEWITQYGRTPLLCEANRDSKDFKISATIDSYSVDYEIIITTDAAKPGFLIPTSTATPIKIEVSVYESADLYYYNTIDYYPPFQLLDDFSIDFLHTVSDSPNGLTVSLQYAAATGSEIFYLAISTYEVVLNPYGMESSDNFSNGESLPCIFESCSDCACYAVDSSDSRLVPFKIKVEGLNASTRKSFTILGLYFKAFTAGQKYRFSGELWSSNGSKLAESRFENAFNPANRKLETSGVDSLSYGYDIVEGEDTFYDFSILLTSSISYPKCLIRFTSFPGMLSNLSSYVDPTTAKVAISSEEVWVLPNAGPNGNSYIPFKLKPPSIQFTPSQTINGNLYCFNSNTYSATSTSFSKVMKPSNADDFVFKSGGTLTATSAYNDIVLNVPNIMMLDLSNGPHMRGVMAIRVTFTSGTGMIIPGLDFYEVLGVSSLPRYSGQLQPGANNIAIILFSSPIEINSSIQIHLPYLPQNSAFSVTLEVFADTDLSMLKYSITSLSYTPLSLTTSPQSPVFIMGKNNPGSTGNNLSFDMFAFISASPATIVIEFPVSSYSIINSFTAINLSLSCPQGFVCDTPTFTQNSISFTVTSGSGTMLANFSSSDTVTMQG